MKKLVKSSVINGEINAPASKSMMQRAIAASLLADGESTIFNYTLCDDTIAAIDVIKKLGAEVEMHDNKLIIKGGLNCKSRILNCGEAGLGIRMFTPIASLCDAKMVLSGEGSLITRPVDMIEKPLTDLGVKCLTNNGFLPIEVNGPLLGGNAEINGSISSQIITGFLMALPKTANDSTITVSNPKSKPYIDMTIELLKDFGVEVINNNYTSFQIKGNQEYKPTEYFVEGDWSGAAFHFVAAAIGGNVKVKNLKINSKQADIAILDALEKVGANVTINDESVAVKKNLLKSFNFDASECPDLFPPLVALASHCKGISVLKGVGRLKHKESDRASVLKQEFENIGVRVDIEGDDMKIYGGTVKGGVINSHNDHRIAMAACVAAVMSESEIVIKDSECINKSYPGFYNDFKKIGGNIYE